MRMMPLMVKANTRRKLVVLFMRNPQHVFEGLRAISRIINADEANTQRELKKLERAEFIIVQHGGKNKYKANRHHRDYGAMKRLCEK